MNLRQSYLHVDEGEVFKNNLRLINTYLAHVSII